MTEPITVHLVALGCARNDVDSEELAGRLEAGGFTLVADPAEADAVVVNTCGFIEAAKKDSIDTLLEAADLKKTGRAKAVVAVGCLAERYGSELAASLPEADAVLSFDDYADIATRLRSIIDGERPAAHVPSDRRLLLPITPVERAGNWPASGPRQFRKRLDDSPSAPLKIGSGCDRRCAFCAIPQFRGANISRPAADIIDEARWLVTQGVREVVLVSENTTSYGKDLRSPQAFEHLLDGLSRVDGLDWVRVSYLQPAELRPTMLQAIASTPNVVPYFDLSFQHTSGPLLRTMRRFGDADAFLQLIAHVRDLSPRAGIRSNFIVGFPGETEADFESLCNFVVQAGLDAIGVFAYSDEDGTEGVRLAGHLNPELIAERTEYLQNLVDVVVDARAASRIGETVEVLVESLDDGVPVGRSAHQGPEVDGTTALIDSDATPGDLVLAEVVGSDGVELHARVLTH